MQTTVVCVGACVPAYVRMSVFRFVRCWCVGVSVGAGVGAWVLLCACARVYFNIGTYRRDCPRTSMLSR